MKTTFVTQRRGEYNIAILASRVDGVAMTIGYASNQADAQSMVDHLNECLNTWRSDGEYFYDEMKERLRRFYEK